MNLPALCKLLADYAPTASTALTKELSRNVNELECRDAIDAGDADLAKEFTNLLGAAIDNRCTCDKACVK